MMTNRDDHDGGDDRTDRSNWGFGQRSERRHRRPARTSNILTVLVTGLTIALLLWQVPEAVGPTLVGAVGAVAFAVTLWLVRMDETLTTFTASLLTIPAGLGLFGGTTGMAIILASDVFPVSDPALLSVGVLVVVGYVGVVAGSSLAVLGVTLSARNVPRLVLRRSTTLVFVTAIVPGAAGLAFVAVVLLFGGGDGSELGIDWFLSSLSREVVMVDVSGLHLGTFLFLVACAVGSLRIAFALLPVGELLADSGLGERSGRRINLFEGALTAVAIGAAVVAGIALAAEAALSPQQLEATLGSFLYGLIQRFTRVPPLRIALIAVTVSAALVTAVTYMIRELARASSTDFDRRMTALVGGLLLTVVVFVTADPVYTAVVSAIADRLPDMIAGDFRDQTTTLADIYGEFTVVVLLTAVIIGITGWFLILLRLTLHFGYLSADATGSALASVGLFVAAVFASTIGTSTWLVLGGIVASFVVWDAGRFGTTLGREVGWDRRTRSTELVHVGGTALVGSVGVVVALVASRLLQIGAPAQSPAGALALVLVVVGVILLVEALR